MAIIDRVKWDGNPEILVWKFPSEELSTYTQLIVNESQTAYLVRGGVYDGPFEAGRHTLSTENIPLLTQLIKLPFGGRTPFSAEVWYVNRVVNLNVKWGTPEPIQLLDPEYKIMLPVRAYGQYGISINDPKLFLATLVGTLPVFTATAVAEYFRGVLLSRIKTEIANAVTSGGYSILTISTQLDALSLRLQEAISSAFNQYGVTVHNFNLISISTPENDPAVAKLKAALAQRAEMSIVGFNYQQARSFDVMQTAAGNEGTAGNIMGAGLGLGVGVGIGGAVGNSFAGLAQNINTSNTPPTNSPPPMVVGAAERIKLLREIGELKQQGILSDEEFAAEKKRILSQ